MVKEVDVKNAIRSGATTAGEIADICSVSAANARRYLKGFAEDDGSDITREQRPNGSGYVYGIEQADEDAGAAEMPVFGNREYDWSQYIPAPSEAEYVESGGELSDITALIDERHATEQLPRFRLTGPPGTGKTTLATTIAADHQWPLINVQFTASMRDSELFGSPHLIGGESVWVDGPLSKALLCSQEQPVVVVLDEVNRAPFHRKSSLQSVLDHRAQADLLLRDEQITGDPVNQITVATMNEGSEYETYPIDPAEKRRHGNTWAVPFLGLVDTEREADIIAERTPVTQSLARAMVHAANEVRKFAGATQGLDDELDGDATSPIEKGIATSTVLEWGKTASAYQASGRPDPVRRAAKSAVVRPHYDEPAASEVLAVLMDAVTSRANTAAMREAT